MTTVHWFESFMLDTIFMNMSCFTVLTTEQEVRNLLSLTLRMRNSNGRKGEMKMIQYNKLVRDRIPEIIESSGKSCKIVILSEENYLQMIDAKLDEELAEYHKDQNIEELADMLEVIRAAAIARGYTLEDLERVRAEKAAKRGGFEKKILLVEVQEV